MPNPWDVKLTHELDEHQMLDYVRHMEAEDRFTALEQVDDMVDRCVNAWHSMRRAENESSFVGWFNSAPVIFNTGITPGWFGGENATYPSSDTTLQIVIKVYPWMDEKHVRYLARMQIEEQT